MLYKRKKTADGKDDPKAPYWVRIRYGGEEIRQSTRTANKRLAERFEKALRESIYEQKTLNKPLVLWNEAADDFERFGVRKGKKSLDGERQYRKWFDYVFDDGRTRLDEINADLINDIGETLLAEEYTPRGAKRSRTRSPATVNRYLSYLRAVLRHAQENKKLAEVPKIELYKEAPDDARNLTDDELARLYAALEKTGRVPHIRALAEFGLETGLRFSNITGLRWDRVQFNEPPEKTHVFIPGIESKSGQPFGIPLSTRAADIVREQIDKHPDFVFINPDGEPIQSIRKAWGRAIRDAKLPGVKFKHLRSSWATRQALRGVPLAIAAKLGGWRDTTMLEKVYIALRSDDLSRWVD